MYLWLKSLHIISLVAWFSGLFYLPRLFVYHCEVSTDETKNYARFCTMEKKTLQIYNNTCCYSNHIFGLWLLFSYSFTAYKTAGWLHAKLGLVVLLWMYHLYCGKLVRTFQNQQNSRSDIFYRYFNEVPTVFLITIVILVVVKPF